ncbi:uncharacterized protein LOC130645853 [Hydractinia symbiolongicarpus]|uniref:uncharacterized protein LOC130645853 n=1 Tax=Hydractinia symbiolongicarpus TaxID=13093 RepID=UPI00254A46ED|nr:uncharacterized protein LOC130645853 [Hydractinia symbiolongicarpus]
MGSLKIKMPKNLEIPFGVNHVTSDIICDLGQSSILKKQISGHWCFNCYHFVDTDDTFMSKKHGDYMYQKFEEIESPREDHLVCICLDCVYYRLQICSVCSKGSPLCMYPLCQWFEVNNKERTCIDCTAIAETRDILNSLDTLCASQCILQCNKCCNYKYVGSFSVFTNAYGEHARRVIRDLDVKKDQQLYKRTICLECRLNEDIIIYRQTLKDRYLSKILSEPVLSAKITANVEKSEQFFGVQSYASAVSGKQFNVGHHKVDVESLRSEEDESNGPVYFLSTMQDYVSQILLKVLQDEIISLRAKTELELKLSGLPLNIWDEILQKKMQFTTHMFSLQSSGLSNFADPESRWAYIAVYTPVHASMVYDIVLQGRFATLLDIITTSKDSDEFNVACFGAGPGSEVLGLNPFLPSHTKYHLLDNCTFWEHNAKSLIKHGAGIDFNFLHFDAQKHLKKEHIEAIKKSKILTFVKFISAIQNQYNASHCLKNIFDIAPSGSTFLIIDNSQPQIKRYVESLIFPNRDFVEKSNCKENSRYQMFTSYAEYRFDVASVMESHEDICKLLSLVMEWVERPPLVDVRVYVFLVRKK